MKKLFLFTAFCLMFATANFAQTLLTEDFSDGVPPTDWTIDDHSANWGASMTANAGGSSPEAKFHWSPEFNGTSRLISPQVDLTGVTTLRIEFKHAIDDYSGGYTIGVGTTSQASTGWNEVWSEVVSGAVSATTINVEIDNNDVGQSDFQFCLFFDGNSYNINDWYIDNVRLYAPFQLDAAMTSLDITPYVEPMMVDISGTIMNDGFDEVTSLDINWQANNGTVYTTALSGLGLAMGDTYDFTADDQLDVAVGEYVVDVWLSNVNGNGDDNNPDNDLQQTTVQGVSGTTTARPLFEEFTSSTCGPCASFNQSFFNNFLDENADDLAVIKYQMNWPGSGDPYYTEEGGVRRIFYGVNAVPDLFLDGMPVATDGGAVSTAYDAALNAPAFMEISAQHAMVGTEISVDVEVTPYANFNDFTVHVVVLENMTVNNVGGNGETEFHYVMMKMLPDAEGTTVNLEEGVTYSQSETADLSGTFIEEFDDLSVVVFVQNNATYEIFQSAWSVDNSTPVAPSVGFDIENNAVNVPIDASFAITFSDAVRNLDDSEITSDDIPNIVALEDADGNAVALSGTINGDATEITVTPDEMLNYETTYTLTVQDVESYDDMAIEATSVTFTTQLHTGIENMAALNCEIYPNPASNSVNITVASEVTGTVQLNVFNVAGELVKTATYEATTGEQTLQLDSSNLDDGLYFFTISNGRYETTERVSIIK